MTAETFSVQSPHFGERAGLTIPKTLRPTPRMRYRRSTPPAAKRRTWRLQLATQREIRLAAAQGLGRRESRQDRRRRRERRAGRLAERAQAAEGTRDSGRTKTSGTWRGQRDHRTCRGGARFSVRHVFHPECNIDRCSLKH